MFRFDVRRLAAIDMHGRTGSPRRRRIIRAEFLTGAILCNGLGVLGLLTAHAAFSTIIGIWLVGAGLNYIPLAAHAVSLSRPGALETELADVDLAHEARHYMRAQLWIAIPLAGVLFALHAHRRPAPL